jgi:hypothetical protein
VSPDFRDLLFAFNAHGVEYLVVGAQALAAHGRVRATGDLDVWVRPEAANAKRVIEALRVFGAPLQDLTETDLTRPLHEGGCPGAASHNAAYVASRAILEKFATACLNGTLRKA